MYESVSVCFEGIATTVNLLARAAKHAAAIAPCVLRPIIDYIALGRTETGDGISPVGIFAAIHRAARQQRGKFGYGDAVKLARENVVNALLKVRYYGRKSRDEPLGYFAQEDARLAGGVDWRGTTVRQGCN